MTIAGSGQATGQFDGSPPQIQPEVDQVFAPWVEPAFRFLVAALPALGLYVLVRVGLLVVDLLSAHLGGGSNIDGPLTAWDGHWYLTVAQSWYPAVATKAAGHLTYGAGVFEPVFPALIRSLESVGASPVVSAWIVSFLFGAASVVLVWRLGCVLYDEQVGRISAVLFTVFPGMGVVWGMLYSECVGLALVAASLLLMLRQRWVWAGVLGAVATATNAMALPLALAALVPTVQALRRREPPRALFTVVLVPMGFIAYVGFLGWHYHSPLYWWHLQREAWSASVDFGRSLLGLLPHPWLGGYQGKGWMEWIGFAAVAAAIYVMVRTKPPLLLFVYCLGSFAMMFVSNSIGFKPRFLIWAFPALISVAAMTRRRSWQAIAIVFAFLLPVVLLAYVNLANYMIQP